MATENAWEETGYNGKYTLNKPPAQKPSKMRIEIGSQEFNYATHVAEQLIAKGMAKFVRWV